MTHSRRLIVSKEEGSLALPIILRFKEFCIIYEIGHLWLLFYNSLGSGLATRPPLGFLRPQGIWALNLFLAKKVLAWWSGSSYRSQAVRKTRWSFLSPLRPLNANWRFLQRHRGQTITVCHWTWEGFQVLVVSCGNNSQKLHAITVGNSNDSIRKSDEQNRPLVFLFIF